jgi:hypothetical protein
LRSTIFSLPLVLLSVLSCLPPRAEETQGRHGLPGKVAWVRPSGRDDKPLWGFRDGIRVGLPPLPGPRGLLRVYTPYLEQTNNHVINFIALEPVTAGSKNRGLSELEHSGLDNTRGKRLWSSDSAEGVEVQSGPARGVVETVGGIEQLGVFVRVEKFENGADVYLHLTFRADRPHEVGIATFAEADSKRLQNCIVTATMGNYARLRTLALESRTVSAGELWPKYKGNDFAAHRFFELRELARDSNGDAIVSAQPDEANPEDANYDAGVRAGWHYHGGTARQYWRAPNPNAELQACVNGRRVYWNSEAALPGGIAFENFELVAPFEQGAEVWFGVEPVKVRSE